MNYTITKLPEKFPKKVNRSDRTQKKLHIGKYAETIIDVYIPVLVKDHQHEIFDKITDAIYENNKGFETCGMWDNKFTLMAMFSTSEFTEQVAIDYVNDIMRIITDVEPSFAEVKEISITYSDAYYGEW